MWRESTSLADVLETELDRQSGFGRDLARELVTEVAEADGMYKGNGQAYLRVGRSALDCILLALKTAAMDKGQIGSILDFACGFGRVTRWLSAAFPDARLAAMDVAPQAIAFVGDVFPVSAHVIDPQWRSVPQDDYDLIWCGSLFTHISREKTGRLLALLFDRLRPGGLLATTTHGAFIADHLRLRSRTYNLSDSAIDELLCAYDSQQYGFASYRSMMDYGISVCRPETFLHAGTTAGLAPLLFVERGWVRDQDFFAFRP